MILLIRHGDALPSRGLDDSRILSMRGRDETRALGEGLRLRGIVPSRIVSSTLVRAVQTAEILATALEHRGVVEVDDALIPDGDPRSAETMLRAASGDEVGASGVVLAVTHEPIVRAIAARLVGQPTFPAFRTSSCVVIQGKRVVLRLDPDTL